MKKINVNVDQLWENTYIRGRITSDTEKTSRFGNAFLEIAQQFDAGEEVDPKDCALTHYFLGDYYGKFSGNREICLRFCADYLKYFKQYFDSIKKRGFDTSISIMLVDMLYGEPYISDGNRRIAILKALGQKEVEVLIDDQTRWIKEAEKFAAKCIKTSYLTSEGKHVLYQPLLYPTLKKFSTPNFENYYIEAMKTIMGVCGSLEGKKVLDIGSCYGYYSFQFVRHGAIVTAVDYHGDRTNLCNNLVRLYNMDWSNPLFICNVIEKVIEDTTLNWDYTFMFNIFHHLYGQNPEESWKTLNQIANKSEVVLLTMDSTHPRNIGEQGDIPALILENSILESCEDVGPILPFKRNLFVFRK